MGDGSFGFCCGEFETLVRYNIPLTVVVFSNATFGWIKAGQNAGFGKRFYNVDFGRTDHAAIAAAFGMKSWRIEDPAELRPTFRRAINAGRPCLIDVIIAAPARSRRPGVGVDRMSLHAVIVGAGINGVSTAIWLQRAGHRVTILDPRGPAGGASFGNGGVLAACSVVPVTTPGLLRRAPRMALDPNQPLFLRWSYLPRMMPWLIPYLAHANARDAESTAQGLAPLLSDSLTQHQALAEGTRATRYVVPCDYAYLYRDRAHFQGDAFGWSLRAKLGYRWDEVEGGALREYEPIFGPDIGFAARLGDHGRISDPGAYIAALATHVVAQGGRVLKTAAETVVTQDGRATGVRAGGEVIDADAVVVTAGAWSGPLARQLGLKVPMESERGYHLDLWEPSVMPCIPVMVAAGKFVATPMDGRLRLAGIVEFGGMTAGPSRAPLDLLERSILEAIPGLTWVRKEEWMGHRPAPTDSLPFLGAVAGIKGAYAGFGHHHVGLTAGAKTGRILAGLIGGAPTNINLAPYAPNRFH